MSMAIPGQTPAERRARRGAALIIVLLLLAVLSVLLAEFSFEQRVQVTLLKNHEAKIKARYVADAGQNAANGLISRVSPEDSRFNNQMVQLFKYSCLSPAPFLSLGLTSGQEKKQEQEISDFANMDNCGVWSLSIPYVLNETPLDLEISDEQARINLNALITRMPVRQGPGNSATREFTYAINQTQLRILFELFSLQAVKHNLQIADADLKTMLDDLVDYISPDVVGGDLRKDRNSYFEYEDNDAVIPMKNGPLDSVDEIRYLPGMSDDLYAAVKDFLTVYPVDENGQFMQRVNWNAASVEVLYALIRGTSYQNEEPSIDADEAMQEANQIIMEAYSGDADTNDQATVSLPRKKRRMPAFTISSSMLNQYAATDLENKPLRFYRIKSTALTDDGLQTTITRVIKYQNPNITTLYYAEE